MSTTYAHEGVVFYLDSVYLDVAGVEWKWTGESSAAGEPMMRSRVDPHRPDLRSPVSLPDVYTWHGPLYRIAPRPTVAERLAAVDVDVDPDYAASVAAGFVESPTAFAARIEAPAAPVPAPPLAAAAGRAFTSPLESRGFRAFLKTLKGARNA